MQLSVYLIILAAVSAIPLLYFPWTPQDPFIVPKEVLFLILSSLLVAPVAFGVLNGKQYSGNKLFLSAIALLAALSISMPFSVNYYRGIAELMRWTGLLIFFLSAAGLDWSNSQIKTLMTTGLATGAFISAFGLLEYFEVLHFGQHPFATGRLYAFFGHQNILAQYLAVTLIWGICLYRATSSKAKKAIYLLTSIVIATGLFATFCRASWIAAASATVLFIYLCRAETPKSEGPDSKQFPMPGIYVSALVIACIILLFMYQSSAKTTELIANALARGDSFRFSIWKTAMSMFISHPLAGVGLGNFDIVYPCFEKTGLPWQVLYAYNEPLHLAAETGLLGLAGISLFMYTVSKRIKEQFVSCDENNGRLLRLGLLAGSVSTLIQGLGSFDLHSPASAVLFFISLGFLCSSSDCTNKGSAARITSVRKILLLLIALVAATGLKTAYSIAAGHYHYGQALSHFASKDLQRSVEHSLLAMKHNPNEAEYEYLAGRQYFTLGHEQKALELFLRAADLSPCRFGELRKLSGKALK